jgi:diguanylate cyclase (GGDEF)-like protein
VGVKRNELYADIEHGLEIQRQLDHIQVTLSQAETAERDYLISGIDRTAVAPTADDRDRNHDLCTLARLVSASPDENAAVQRLRRHLTQRQTIIDNIHHLGQQGDWQQASEKLLTGAGHDANGQVEQDIAVLRQEMEQQIDRGRSRQMIYERDVSRFTVALRLVMFISMTMVFAGVWATGRRMNQAHQAQIRLTEMLATQATADGLTGLKNHRAFQERLAQEFERWRRYRTPFAIVLLDVDSFKAYNDAYGHPEGDTVLKTVATILQGSAREADFVARYGGEEFVLLLPNTEALGAVEAAERCRAAIAAHAWQLRSVTASFGVAAQQHDTYSAQALLSAADRALYASKAAGRNCVTLAEPT